MVDARGALVRALHDHARQHGRERRAPVDPARPRHRRSPSSSGSSTAYALSFAVFLLTGGKLADLLRPAARSSCRARRSSPSRRSPAASRGSAGLPDRRAGVQGVGAALMMPATLSIISAMFPPRERGAAIGIWAGVSAMALAIGPLVGGVLAEKVNWNWIFFINVPVGVLGDRRRVHPRARVARHERTSSGSTSPGLITSASPSSR